MTTKPHSITVSGVEVAVVRKAIRNLHLGVYPPDGRVRVAAPMVVSDAAVRVAVIGKLRWIRRQQAAFAAQPRESEREIVSGESHYFLGRRYLLEVVERDGPSVVRIKNARVLLLETRAGSPPLTRALILQRWYRAELREIVPALVDRWQRRLGVRLAALGHQAHEDQVGLLQREGLSHLAEPSVSAKKPPECLEYIVVHGFFVHLKAHKHDERFVTLMDQHLPRWRHARKVLNTSPLASETWKV